MNGEPLRVLSESDWTFWKRNGYVIIPEAVPEKNVDSLIEALWKFQEMDPKDPTTWYHNPAREIQMTELRNSGMVEIYNHQALWDNRQHPRIYDAFVDIWGLDTLILPGCLRSSIGFCQSFNLIISAQIFAPIVSRLPQLGGHTTKRQGSFQA